MSNLVLKSNGGIDMIEATEIRGRCKYIETLYKLDYRMTIIVKS